jgi:hypothetical protein
MKFEIGKWYKNEGWSSSKDFAKASFDETNSIGEIKYSEKIYQGEHSFRSGSWSSCDSCIEATLEEIQKYLPKGHPDKINPDNSYYEIF